MLSVHFGFRELGIHLRSSSCIHGHRFVDTRMGIKPKVLLSFTSSAQSARTEETKMSLARILKVSQCAGTLTTLAKSFVVGIVGLTMQRLWNVRRMFSGNR